MMKLGLVQCNHWIRCETLVVKALPHNETYNGRSDHL
jgi:hypothetical protein